MIISNPTSCVSVKCPDLFLQQKTNLVSKKRPLLIKLITVTCLMLFAAFFAEAQPTQFGAQSNIQPFYIGDDNGAYYMVKDGDKIRWFGEHPGKRYAIVFWGKKNGKKISGKWWSLSKYAYKGRGTLEAKLEADNKITITNETGGFPVSKLRPKNLTPDLLVQLPFKERPEWATNKDSNLSGAFKSKKKNVICYSRQLGKNVRMFCESKATGGKKASYSYIFLGKLKDNNKAVGKVYALSKGKQSGSAKATYYLKGKEQISSASEFDLGGKTWKRVNPNYRKKINEYLRAKKNNPDNILQLEKNPTGSPQLVGQSDPRFTQEGSTFKHCEVKQWDFSKNTASQTVLNDITLYPGALVSIDQKFLKGEPQLITGLPQSKNTYTIMGLSGFPNKKKKSFTIDSVNRSKFNDKLDKRLNTWRQNSNKVDFKPKAGQEASEYSWSKEQFLLDIGVNFYSPSANIATSVSHGQTSESYTFYAYARYDFFSVVVDEKESPAHWFTPQTTLSMVKSVHRTDKMRLGYVSSVTYGSVFLVSFEFDRKESFTDVEAAVQAVTAGGVVDANTGIKHNKAMENIKMKVLVTGGDWEPVEHSGDVNEIIRQYNDIKNKIVNNSDPAQGVPVAYKINFLKNNAVAEIGQTANYESETCEVRPDYITFENRGGYTAVLRLVSASGELIGERKLKNGKKVIKIPSDADSPFVVEIKTRSILKPLDSRGKWNFFKELTAYPGCNYRMGGKTQKQAALIIQDCDNQ